LAAVEAACAEALEAGLANADVILNVLARRQQPPSAEIVSTPEQLSLRQPPVADCARYDALLRPSAATSMEVACGAL
jgi:hypothetical protein